MCGVPDLGLRSGLPGNGDTLRSHYQPRGGSTNSSGWQPGAFGSSATICLSFVRAGPALAAEGDSPGAMQGLCVGTASPWGHRTAPPPRSQTRLRIPPQPSARFPQPQPRGPGSYRKANAHGGGEGAWDELALVKLDQQRRLPHAAVSNQDGLQGARQGTSAHGGWRCPSVPPGCSFWGNEEKGRGLGGGSSRSRGAARPREQPRWAAGCPHRLPGATARWLEPWCPVLRRHLWSCCLPGEGFPPLGASLTHGPAPG